MPRSDLIERSFRDLSTGWHPTGGNKRNEGAGHVDDPELGALSLSLHRFQSLDKMLQGKLPFLGET